MLLHLQPQNWEVAEGFSSVKGSWEIFFQKLLRAKTEMDTFCKNPRFFETRAANRCKTISAGVATLITRAASKLAAITQIVHHASQWQLV